MTNDEIKIRAVESLGKFCVEQKDMDLGGALAAILSALRSNRMKELSRDIVQLGISKQYLDEETRQAAIQAGR